jgi:alpha-tubulin suppressor-like RCC1 family protein
MLSSTQHLYDWGNAFFLPNGDTTPCLRITLPSIDDIDSIKNALVYCTGGEPYIAIPKCADTSKVAGFAVEYLRKEITEIATYPIEFTSYRLTSPETIHIQRITCGYSHALLLSNTGELFSL